MEFNFHPSDYVQSGNDSIHILENASKPSSPETDNHVTGFWKGMAITAGITAISLGVIIYTLAKKD